MVGVINASNLEIRIYIEDQTYPIKQFIRWLRPILKTGMIREIDDDDIYAVTKSMQSDLNTEAFTKLWKLELKKTNPSLLRVMLKVHGLKVLILLILHPVGNTLAR